MAVLRDPDVTVQQRFLVAWHEYIALIIFYECFRDTVVPPLCRSKVQLTVGIQCKEKRHTFQEPYFHGLRPVFGCTELGKVLGMPRLFG